MAIKGLDGVSDRTPGAVAVQLSPFHSPAILAMADDIVRFASPLDTPEMRAMRAIAMAEMERRAALKQVASLAPTIVAKR